MNLKDCIPRPSLRRKAAPINAKLHQTSTAKKLPFRKISGFVLILLVFTSIANVLPATATSILASTQTFTAVADAQVDESHPSTNYGTTTYLNVVGASKPDIESYIRFTVSGLTTTVQSAKVRVFDTNDPSTNGPAIYGTSNTWTETGITWNNRTARTTGVIGNTGAIKKHSWVEYSVTSVVTTNGTYSFVLAADSADSVRFSPREGTKPPQLVLTLASTSNTPTSTPINTQTPIPTSSGDPVFVGAGDITSCSQNNDEATAKLLDNIPGTVFTAGDNTYPDGTYDQYVNCYGPTWGRHKDRTKPVPGNHEYNIAGAPGYFQYFNNPPAYYAYALGSWRIYALNSEIDVSTTGPQATWLQNDLAAHPSLCVLAYWHKPRWSSGSVHGSNSNMQALWQILYNAKAELVINGHDHEYERFAEMNASGSAISPGLREVVVGTGGEGLYSFGTILSASQVRNSSTHGVLKLILHSTSYNWNFVPIAGQSFTDSGSTNCH